MSKKEKVGYHINSIARGTYGELSKIQEELNEAFDAEEQQSKIMLLVELSDLYGALEAVAEANGSNMNDLANFSAITKRAFRNGVRK